MSFYFRRMIGADAGSPVRDFKLDAAYAGVAKKGDIVKLNGVGEVVAAVAADPAVLGLYVGPLIKMTSETVTYGKVISAAEAVFEVTVTGGTPVADGAGYALGLTAGDYFLNAALRTTPCLKLVGPLSNGNYEVVLSGRQLN